MGVAFKDIIISKEIELDFLKNKILVLDAYNVLYQFLTTIRGIDGTLLTDSKGNTTSHLVGLFTRTTSLMQRNIKPVFVFDGKPPELKQKVNEQRNKLKLEAEEKFLEAKKREDLEEMKKYASRTSRLSKDMVEESKKLISLLGLPVVQAPSEGEAQAAYMVQENKGFAVGSQDFDSSIMSLLNLEVLEAYFFISSASSLFFASKNFFSASSFRAFLFSYSFCLSCGGLPSNTKANFRPR